MGLQLRKMKIYIRRERVHFVIWLPSRNSFRGIYCYPNFFCYANFSIIFRTKVQWGQKSPRGANCFRGPPAPPPRGRKPVITARANRSLNSFIRTRQQHRADFFRNAYTMDSNIVIIVESMPGHYIPLRQLNLTL